MSLKALEINGFKSFGKKTTLDFTTSITAIVGPNGSGKSNVAEAFRFVLGEQSLKSMRGKKGEDLIFNGSNDAPRGNRAGVKLVFDNISRIFNVDFDEVSIERVVFRDGGNEYAINGSKVRLKNILELLAGANIGASGHHIISQGEADRILHANPKERREMIEDALGIKIYQYKKEESEKKLDRTEDNIKQVESLRREIAPHLKFLRRQVEKLEKADELKNELTALAKTYFRQETFYVTSNQTLVSQKKQIPQSKLLELDNELRRAKERIEREAKDGSNTPEIVALEKNLEAVRYRKDTTLRDLGKIEGEISYTKKAIEREESLQKEEDNKTISFKEVVHLERHIAEIASKGLSLSTLESLKEAVASIQNAFREFVLRNKDVTESNKIDLFEVELLSLAKQKELIESQIEQEKQEERSLLAQYEQKRIEIEKAKDETREAEKQVFVIVAKQNELHSELDRLKGEERQLQFDDESLKNDIQEVGALVGVEALKFEGVELDEGATVRSVQMERKRQLERLKIRLEEMGIAGGDDIKKEFKDTEDRDVFLAQELLDLAKAKEDLAVLIKELTEKLDIEFKEGVKKINDVFGEYFGLMFGGGHASLKVVRQEKRRKKDDLEGLEEGVEELEEGIEIEVSLPHKKIKGLMMLSGGERALTSIALLFAISQVNPPPFVILDETDAALDEANSRKYGDMVENLAKHSELIVITHNRETMSRAGVLYGVTMGKDATSKLLSISFNEAEAVAK